MRGGSFVGLTPDQLRRAEIGLGRIRRSMIPGLCLTWIFLVLALAAFVWEARFARLAVRTSGQVVKVLPEKATDRVTYRFVDDAGKERRGSESCSHGAYRVGDRSDVLFVPGHPAA